MSSNTLLDRLLPKPASMLHRTSPIDGNDLLDVVEDTLASLGRPLVSVDLEDQPVGFPALVIREHERVHAIPVDALAVEMTLDRVAPDAASLRDALHRWVDLRPVTDVEAAQEGVAVLSDVDDTDRLRWQIVVPRDEGVVTWVPSIHLPRTELHAIRAAARDRAAALERFPFVSGALTVWISLQQPALSTGILAGDLRVLTDAHPGRGIEDLFVVATPGRPFVCGEEESVQRLVEEVVDPYLMFPLASVESLGWV